jgi:replication factor C subunit 1
MKSIPYYYSLSSKKIVDPSAFFGSKEPIRQTKKTFSTKKETIKGEVHPEKTDSQPVSQRLKENVAPNSKRSTEESPKNTKKAKIESDSPGIVGESSGKSIDSSPAGKLAPAVSATDSNEEKPKKFNYFQLKAQKDAHQITESRPSPVGAPDCLTGKTFVFTGDLKSLTREEATDIVKRYAGYQFH